MSAEDDIRKASDKFYAALKRTINGDATQMAEVWSQNSDVSTLRVYSIEDARTFLSARALNIDALAEEVGDKFVSAFIRASKPAMSCCEAG
jgi:arsenite methyltransferase